MKGHIIKDHFDLDHLGDPLNFNDHHHRLHHSLNHFDHGHFDDLSGDEHHSIHHDPYYLNKPIKGLYDYDTGFDDPSDFHHRIHQNILDTDNPFLYSNKPNLKSFYNRQKLSELRNRLNYYYYHNIQPPTTVVDDYNQMLHYASNHYQEDFYLRPNRQLINYDDRVILNEFGKPLVVSNSQSYPGN